MAKSSSTGLLLLVAAGAAAIALSPKTATAQPAPKQPGLPPPTPTSLPPSTVSVDGCEIEASIPPNVKAQIAQSLASTSLSPADYDELATTTEQAGFPKAGACLRAKGLAQKLQMQADIDSRGGMPFVIRYGDIPYLLAEYYTGNGARFRELEPINDHLGPLTTINGVSNYPGWIVGTEILIPKAWNPLSKPIPPVATGSLPVSVPGQSSIKPQAYYQGA